MTKLAGIRKTTSALVVLCVATLVSVVGSATGYSQAAPLRVEIKPTGSSGLFDAIVIESSDFLTLIKAVISQERELSRLTGQAISASVSYLGVDDSLKIEVDSSLNSVRISMPLTGYSVELKESSGQSLFQLAENLITTEGGNRFAELRQEINKRSTIGVTDGNPRATTALLASSVFNTLRQLTTAPKDKLNFRTRFSENSFRTMGFKGFGNEAAFTFSRPSASQISYAASGFATKMDLSGSDIWGAGLNAIAMKNVYKSESLHPVAWNIGGHAGIVARGSQNLASGGALYDLGLDSSLGSNGDSGWGFWLHSSFNNFSGIPVQIDGFQLDSAVNQMMVKNALVCRKRFGTNSNLILTLVDTRFLKSSAVSDYRSYEAQFEMKMKQNLSMYIGFEKEDARGHRNLRAELALHFAL